MAEGTIGGTPISQLPPSSFAYCEPGNGAVSTRCHFPIRDKNGKADPAHVRAALSRLSTSAFGSKARAKVEAAARELGIGEPAAKADFLKAEQVGPAKWRVLGIPFGGPFKGRDFDGEFFSQRTDIKPDWFDRRPLVWHHNMDATMKADPVLGTADDLELKDEGWWSTLWLDRSHRYWSKVDELLRSGKIYGSSGSLPHFVRTNEKTGEILVWPYIEQTITPTPANPYSVVVAAKAVSDFDEASIILPPAVRGLFTFDLDSPPADLPADLPSGGDAAATQRVADALTLVRGLEDRLGTL